MQHWEIGGLWFEDDHDRLLIIQHWVLGGLLYEDESDSMQPLQHWIIGGFIVFILPSLQTESGNSNDMEIWIWNTDEERF